MTRYIHACCPRITDDIKRCNDEQEIEVEVFYEGGWVGQFETPTSCTEGHVWTPEEIKQVTDEVMEKAVEPREPD